MRWMMYRWWCEGRGDRAWWVIESVFFRSPDKGFWACLGDISGRINNNCVLILHTTHLFTVHKQLTTISFELKCRMTFQIQRKACVTSTASLLNLLLSQGPEPGKTWDWVTVGLELDHVSPTAVKSAHSPRTIYTTLPPFWNSTNLLLGS